MTGKTEVIGLSDLMTLFFIDLGCLYCKQMQRALNFFKNTLNWLKIDSVVEKLFDIQLTRMWKLLTWRWNTCHWDILYIVFSQLAVKGLSHVHFSVVLCCIGTQPAERMCQTSALILWPLHVQIVLSIIIHIYKDRRYAMVQSHRILSLLSRYDKCAVLT
jgi:hypothetical protein